MARNVLKQPELADSHPTTASRVADRGVIDGAVESFTRSLPMAEVVAACADGEVPCGAVNTIEDIFSDPQFEAREVLARVAHDVLGEVVMPSVLPRLTETPGRIEGVGPELGDWNGDRLAQLLASDDEVRHPASS